MATKIKSKKSAPKVNYTKSAKESVSQYNSRIAKERGGGVSTPSTRPLKNPGSKPGESRKVYPAGHPKEYLNAQLPQSTISSYQQEFGKTPGGIEGMAGTEPTATTPTPQPTAAPGTITDPVTGRQFMDQPGYQEVGGSVATPAAAPTPTQNKFQTALQGAQAAGVQASPDPGVARTQLAPFIPQQADTGVVDTLYQENPELQAITRMATDYFSPQNQKVSLLDDYKKLRRKSGLDDINEEIIDAETIIDGTEDDIRNEIQMAGGFGTESQVQAMTLARNKGLLKRYNQLVSMKEQATQELNMMMNLTAQDRQMAAERFNTQMSLFMNLANFRQQALQNTRQQYQWMATQMGADGLYNSLSQDPRQLAIAEKILGVGAGGLLPIAQSAAAERQRKNSLEERQIRVSEGNLSLGWASLQHQKDKAAADAATTSTGQSPQDTVKFLRDTVTSAKSLSGGAGQSGISRFLGNMLIGDTKRNRLSAQVESLKSNMLTLATDPNIKKFFGPQMSDNDVRAMQAAGTTLNVDGMSEKDLLFELNRMDAIFSKLEGATTYDPSGGTWIVQ